MQDVKQVLKKVSEIVTEKPVQIEVVLKPQNWLQKLLMKWKLIPVTKTIFIEQTSYGNLIRISELLVGIDIKMFVKENILESNYQAIAQHGRNLTKIVAIAIHNKKGLPPESLISFIETHFTTKDLLNVVMCVFRQMDVTSFMATIVSIKGQNVLEENVSAENAS